MFFAYLVRELPRQMRQAVFAALGLAVALAIAGGLIARGFGSWRAAQPRPAAALARAQ